MSSIQRALISVHDKAGLIPFAQTLAAHGVEILSTGGTARALRDAAIEVKDLSEFTGFPEMLDGRVKTLHPKVHAGILHRRDDDLHVETVKSHAIPPIDLVVVNLYPFEATVARPDVTLELAIENIDVGGPTMLRAAAKNHDAVTVVMDPADYPRVAEQLQATGGTSIELRRELAAKVFVQTTRYDGAIANYLSEAFIGGKAGGKSEDQVVEKSLDLPSNLAITAPLVMPLRYGENPHQVAGLYGDFQEFFEQLHGKELSYNNILDLTAAAQLIMEFQTDGPTVAILKHMNPCGVGQGDHFKEAWTKAFATDQQAPFGGIIAANGKVDVALADAILEIFSEVIVAPEYCPNALEMLRKKKNLRLIRIVKNPTYASPWDIRGVGAGSYLLQEKDVHMITKDQVEVVTKRSPTAEELRAMIFGWRVVKHIKSNAITYVKSDRTLGIGAGQMSRVDSSRIAVWKANEAGLNLSGSVVCSDAFFRFQMA